MKLFGIILISVSLLILPACSTTPAAPEIRVVTKVERAVPPEGLVQQCQQAADRQLGVTKDLIDSRQDWITSLCECASKMARLIEWNTGQKPAELPACRKISR